MTNNRYPFREIILNIFTICIWAIFSTFKYLRYHPDIIHRNFCIQRQGIILNICYCQLRVGDIVWVKEGSILPFDGVVLSLGSDRLWVCHNY